MLCTAEVSITFTTPVTGFSLGSLHFDTLDGSDPGITTSLASNSASQYILSIHMPATWSSGALMVSLADASGDIRPPLSAPASVHHVLGTTHILCKVPRVHLTIAFSECGTSALPAQQVFARSGDDSTAVLQLPALWSDRLNASTTTLSTAGVALAEGDVIVATVQQASVAVRCTPSAQPGQYVLVVRATDSADARRWSEVQVEVLVQAITVSVQRDAATGTVTVEMAHQGVLSPRTALIVAQRNAVPIYATSVIVNNKLGVTGVEFSAMELENNFVVAATLEASAGSLQSFAVVNASLSNEFVVSQWGECDVGSRLGTCGVGWQYRTVECRRQSTGQVVGLSWCTGDPPVTAQSCSSACGTDSADLQVTAWSTCVADVDEPCSPGHRNRTVQCREPATGSCQAHIVDAMVTSLPCLTAPKPDGSTCQSHPHAVTWVLGSWGACQGGCEGGLRSRQRQCVDAASTKPVPAIMCLRQDVAAGVASPATTAKCDPSCNSTRIVPGPWSKCSEPCGGHGVATRQLFCVVEGVVQPGMAACEAEGVAMPTDSRPCNTHRCRRTADNAYTLVPGPWSACSAACGGGLATRALTCVQTTATASLVSNAYPGDLTSCFQQLSPTLALPPSTVPCGLTPCAGAPCTSNRDCMWSGVCNTTSGTCTCKQGWTGARCGVLDACASSTVDRDGSCCHSGVVSRNGVCCVGNASLDASGECCADGVAPDVCGVCGGTATAVDAEGGCCRGSLDASGMCCPVPAIVDECGVCGGTNDCDVIVAVAGSASASRRRLASVEFPRIVNLTNDLRDAMEVVPGVALVPTPATFVEAHATGAGWDVSIRLRGHGDGASTIGPDAITALEVALASGPLPAVWGNAASVVTSTHRAPKCGNGVCEVGEACASTVYVAGGVRGCCPHDCVVSDAACPTAKPGTICSGHGKCLAATGVCSCHGAYTGGDCTGCSLGWGWVHDSAGGHCSPLGQLAELPTILVGDDDEGTAVVHPTGGNAEVVSPTESPVAGGESGTSLVLAAGAIGVIAIAAAGVALATRRRNSQRHRVVPTAAVAIATSSQLTVDEITQHTISISWPEIRNGDVDAHVVEYSVRGVAYQVEAQSSNPTFVLGGRCGVPCSLPLPSASAVRNIRVTST